MKAKEEEAKNREKQYRESQEALIDLTRKLREAKDAESKIKLEYEQKLLEEQEVIKSNAKKEAEDELNLRIAEKEKS